MIIISFYLHLQMTHIIHILILLNFFMSKDRWENNSVINWCPFLGKSSRENGGHWCRCYWSRTCEYIIVVLSINSFVAVVNVLACLCWLIKSNYKTLRYKAYLFLCMLIMLICLINGHKKLYLYVCYLSWVPVKCEIKLKGKEMKLNQIKPAIQKKQNIETKQNQFRVDRNVCRFFFYI